MNSQLPTTVQKPSRYVVPLVVAAIATATCLVLLLVMVGKGQFLVDVQLSGNLWFVLLLLLGLAAALTVFALFKSHAKYTGKALRGEIELGGPVVVMLTVVVLGFWLVPPPPVPEFQFSIFLQGEAGPQEVPVRKGTLVIDLGQDRRKANISVDGEARFLGIPTSQKNKTVVVVLESEQYELTDASIKLEGSSLRKTVRPKLLRLVGDVSDQGGKPLAGAQVVVAAQRTSTDEHGRFELLVPANLADVDREVIVSAPGFDLWRSQAHPGGSRLQISLLSTKLK